jgi:hypothetical protein
MPMPKKQIIGEEMRAALRWTDGPIEPDIPIPQGSAVTDGFLITGKMPYSAVTSAKSRATSHGTATLRSSAILPSTQGGRSLYSSRLLALQALRYEFACFAAGRLSEIDKMIDFEWSKIPLPNQKRR